MSAPIQPLDLVSLLDIGNPKIIKKTINEIITLANALNVQLIGKVNTSTTINGKALTDNITLTYSDVGAMSASQKVGYSIVADGTLLVLQDQDGNVLSSAYTQDTTYSTATTESAGLMSTTDKTNLDTLVQSASSFIDKDVNDLTYYMLTTDINTLVDGLQTKITSSNKLSADLIGTTGTTNQFMTATEKTKLSGIESGAQVNTVASVNSKTGIVVLTADDISDTNTTNKFVTATEKASYAGKQNALTFDSTPTVNSSNPVTSAGIKTYVDSAIYTSVIAVLSTAV